MPSGHPREKVGFYGGSFDPIHFGHINLALELMEAHQLKEVWFCPAWVSPHRQDRKPVPAEHRLEMLKLALEGISGFHLLDLECRREQPSYTVDTLKELLAQDQKESKNRQWHLLLGDDAAANFLNWHQPAEIVSMVPLLVGTREKEPFSLELFQKQPLIYESVVKGITPTRVMEISSTEIRQRLNQGLYCGHLVPAKVMDYIYDNRLYLSL